METHILIIGNPVDGFEFIGPFVTSDEATSYGNEYVDEYSDADWWVVSLNPKVPHE